MIKIARVLGIGVFVVACMVIVITTFIVGYARGYSFGKNDTEVLYKKFLTDKVSSTTAPIATPSSTGSARPLAKIPSWSGPDLWNAVNKARIINGVNGLSTKEELCTIASIRLNEIIDLGKLDGHAGFSKMPIERPDLKWIFEKYNLSEFLVSGATSADDAVSLWENTLGHKQLLTGGEYVWGCTYAQAGFGVAIAAY